MNTKFTEDHKEPNLMARVLSPLGTYPAKSVIMPESAFIADNDICFILSLTEKLEVDNENYYSEMEWASLEEIRLFASLLLGVKPDHKYTRVYPFPFRECITVSGKIDFENQEITNKIKELLIKKIDAPDKQVPGYPNPQVNHYQNLYGISLPPSNGGPNYDFRNTDINYELQSAVYNSINKKDFLTVRGLSVLIKSIMLRLHHQFIEESITTLFISLEASLRLVLRALKQQGNRNPTSEDAMNYIQKVFDMPPIYINNGSKIRHMKNYFQEYYESRIKSVHPESRFGIFPFAQLQLDDFYWLKNDLIEVYTFLLTGQVNTSWQNDG